MAYARPRRSARRRLRQGGITTPACLVLAAAPLASTAAVAGASTAEDCSRDDGTGAFLADRGPGPHSGDLVPGNFLPCVKDSATPWLVEFHSELCSTCQAFQSTWWELTALLREEAPPGLRCGRIGIDKEDGVKLADAEGTLQEGVPNIYLYPGRGRPSVQVYAAGEADTFPPAAELRKRVASRYLEATATTASARAPAAALEAPSAGAGGAPPLQAPAAMLPQVAPLQAEGWAVAGGGIALALLSLLVLVWVRSPKGLGQRAAVRAPRNA